jgi:hypothetical protein
MRRRTRAFESAVCVRELGQLPEYFTVHSWRVFTQSTHGQETDTECTCAVDGQRSKATCSGGGQRPGQRA